MDHLEGELMSELENARLVRLMAKFGFINERPEYVSYCFRILLTVDAMFLSGLHATPAGLKQATGISSSFSETTFSTRSTNAESLSSTCPTSWRV